MLVILYPDNTAYPDNDIRVSIGTNETFGIPAVRKASTLLQIEETQTFFHGEHTIKAFYNDFEWTKTDEQLMEEARREQERKERQLVAIRYRNKRNREKKRSMLSMINAKYNELKHSFNDKEDVCPINA
jgi:hypothetical protein